MRIARWLGFVALLLAAAGCGGPRGKTPPAQPKGDGVQWQIKFEEALKQAKQQGKPVLVDVMATWCEPCKHMQRDVWSRPDVGELSKSFVPVQVDGDLRSDLKAKLGVHGYPVTIFLSPEGTEIERVLAAVPYEDMLKAMQGVLDKMKVSK
jgi:uncharacterized protein YyaL (SSP411 family)